MAKRPGRASRAERRRELSPHPAPLLPPRRPVMPPAPAARSKHGPPLPAASSTPQPRLEIKDLHTRRQPDARAGVRRQQRPLRRRAIITKLTNPPPSSVKEAGSGTSALGNDDLAVAALKSATRIGLYLRRMSRRRRPHGKSTLIDRRRLRRRCSRRPSTSKKAAAAASPKPPSPPGPPPWLNLGIVRSRFRPHLRDRWGHTIGAAPAGTKKSATAATAPTPKGSRRLPRSRRCPSASWPKKAAMPLPRSHPASRLRHMTNYRTCRRRQR